MYWPIAVGGAVLAMIVVYLSVPLVEKIATRTGAMDHPDVRKVHQKPMPRLGGMAIFIGFIIAVLATVKVQGPYQGIIIGGIIIFIVGVLDDLYSLSAWAKLGGQIVAAGAAIYFGLTVEFMRNPFDGIIYLGQLSLPLTMLWIVGISNAINLIDGLDGLAAGVSGIAALTMGIVALMEGQYPAACMAFILVGALLGFLPHNFYPARIFMGDSGALFLGFTLSCLAVAGMAKSTAVISLIIPVIILGIPIFDTLCAILRRATKKAPIFSPDRGHLHHRLMAMGYSHRMSVCIIYGISLFFAVVALILTRVSSLQATIILALLLAIIVAGAIRVGIVTSRPRIREQEQEHGSGDPTHSMKM